MHPRATRPPQPRRSSRDRPLEREPADEDAQSPEGELLLRREQLETPIEDRVHGSLPLGSFAIAALQEKPAIQAVEQVSGAHERGVSRGEFQRERQPVESPADLDHYLDAVGVERKVGPRAAESPA